MITDYKIVSIYADFKNNLILIPNGEAEDLQMELDLVSEIKIPYSEDQLEELLLKVMDQCFLIKPDIESKMSPIEKHLGIKGYSKATKGLKYVSFNWNSSDGFFFTPSIKRKGYDYLPDETVYLGKSFQKGELAKAVKKALEISG